MPLIHDDSDEAFHSNLKAELAAGKPKDQALAIAYSVRRRAAARKRLAKAGYDPNESRDKHGEWTSSGVPLHPAVKHGKRIFYARRGIHLNILQHMRDQGINVDKSPPKFGYIMPNGKFINSEEAFGRYGIGDSMELKNRLDKTRFVHPNDIYERLQDRLHINRGRNRIQIYEVGKDGVKKRDVTSEQRISVDKVDKAGHDVSGEARDEHGRWISVGRKELKSKKKGNKKTFVFTDAKTGKPLAEEHQQRLRQTKPQFGAPGYTDHRYYPNAKTSYIATAVDNKDRIQRYYSSETAAANAAEKWGRLQRVMKSYKTLEANIAKAVSGRNPDQESLVLRLISKTGMRPGSTKDMLARSKSYGATTLRVEHATIVGNKVVLRFTGKSGRRSTYTIDDPALVRHVKYRKANHFATLFDTTPAKVATRLRELSGTSAIKVKDLRTAIGTSHAMDVLSRMNPAMTDKEFKSLQREVARRVSRVLHNTPAIALNSYIAPHVWHTHMPKGSKIKIGKADDPLLDPYNWNHILENLQTLLDSNVEESVVSKAYASKYPPHPEYLATEQGYEAEQGHTGGEDFDSEHPRFPAGSPGSKGGEFAPKDADVVVMEAMEGKDVLDSQSLQSRTFPDNAWRINPKLHAKLMNEGRISMSENERHAVDDYMQSGYDSMNRLLRGSYTGSSRNIVRAKIKSLDSVLKAAPPIERDVVVYRGVPNYVADQIKPGVQFHDTGFVSTSVSPKVASNFSPNADDRVHVLRIKVPKGTKALVYNSAEYEVLLPRGSQFRITKVEDGWLAGTHQDATVYYAELTGVKKTKSIRQVRRTSR